LVKNSPAKHYDISSSLYFSAILSSVLKIEFYDYRPADLQLSNLHCGKADLQHLPFLDSSIESLSCMHVLEHIGLGRYGDPIDPLGDIKASNELVRVLAPNGCLIIVVPIGLQRICFNAHRIYSYSSVIKMFGNLRLKEFSLIPDPLRGDHIIMNASEEVANLQEYGCGLFVFVK
jgi:hypothetical protein